MSSHRLTMIVLLMVVIDTVDSCLPMHPGGSMTPFDRCEKEKPILCDETTVYNGECVNPYYKPEGEYTCSGLYGVMYINKRRATTACGRDCVPIVKCVYNDEEGKFVYELAGGLVLTPSTNLYCKTT